jgi:hypothetical protein
MGFAVGRRSQPEALIPRFVGKGFRSTSLQILSISRR